MKTYRNAMGVVVLLEDDKGRIALQLRDDIPDLPGANQWGLFGGLLKSGETFEACALREVNEELMVSLDPEKLKLVRRHYAPEENLETYVFHYPVTNELDDAQLQEGQTWSFKGADDLEEQEVVFRHARILRDYWAE